MQRAAEDTLNACSLSKRTLMFQESISARKEIRTLKTPSAMSSPMETPNRPINNAEQFTTAVKKKKRRSWGWNIFEGWMHNKMNKGYMISVTAGNCLLVGLWDFSLLGWGAVCLRLFLKKACYKY